jgi:LPPG:FO 2-phospho-L-lactate transferase
MIVALAGGVGGAKLAAGLAARLPADRLLVVVNTGDDFVHLGLHVSPDLDTVMYWLAGLSDTERGWGLADESWHGMAALEALGGPAWFRLGDRDLATHLERTRRLHGGDTLSSVTDDFCRRLGIRHRIAPMTDDAVRTIVHTPDGPLEFQHYFVRLQCAPRVTELEFAGAAMARPGAAFERALAGDDLEAIVFCPSNPLLSIQPMLAIPGVRERLGHRRAPAVAVSPIVAGQAIKGPAAKMLSELGREASALEVARFYRGLVDGVVIDERDAALGQPIESLGLAVCVTDTIMRNAGDRERLAGTVIAFAAALRDRPAPMR